MRTAAQFTWEISRAFVEKRLKTPIVTKSSKVITTQKRPITVRRLFLTGDFVTTHSFRCIPVIRSGVLSWSVSALTEPEKPLWAMPKLRIDPEGGPAWKKWASMTAAEFSDWLARVLGPERAIEALREPKVASFFASISSFSDLKRSQPAASA